MRPLPVVPRFVVAAALLVILGLAVGAWFWMTTSCHNGNPSLVTFYVVANPSYEKQVVQAFQHFAENNGFSFAITYYTPNHDEFLMALTRKDTEILAGNGAYGLDKYDVHFYNNDCIHPTTAADIEGLVSALKALASTVPDAKVTAEP